MTSPSVSDDAAMTSASQNGCVAADATLQPARRRNTDQRDRFARGEPVELAAGNGQRLVDRVDTGQIDNLAADDHENIRRDDAVTVVDRGIFPQPADVGEAGTRGSRAHHAMTALHADDAVKIDRQNRSSTSPWNTRIRGVVAASVTRSKPTPIALAAISRASTSPISSLRWRARISDAPIAVARTRWVC